MGQIRDELAQMVQPGITTGQLEKYAEEKIREIGGEPSFKGYTSRHSPKAFPTALCVSFNEEIVHAPSLPSRAIKEGDIISIDLGMKYKSMFTDTAVTVGAGKISAQANKLIKITKKALAIGVNQAKAGNFVSDIGRAIQRYVEGKGLGVLRHLTGHGVGHQVHEEPKIPNFFDAGEPKIELKEGMVIAIEPMVVTGDWQIETLADGWTVVTKDRSLGAHFEHTVIVAKRGGEIVTE